VRITLKGSSSSGWYAPGRGTHTGEKHRAIGSGKSGKARGKKPAVSKSLAERAIRAPSQKLVDAVDNSTKSRAYLRDIGIKEYEATCQKNMEKFLSESAVSIRAPVMAVESILESGRFKNQYETGKSKGAYNPKLRQKVESKAFNVKPGEDPANYPIYGYMGNPGYTDRGVTQYGAVEFVLKSSIRNRTTFTVGDSFGGFADGEVGATPVNNPGKLSWDLSSMYVHDDAFQVVNYVEAQIHGGIKLSDIDHVVMHGTQPEYSVARSALEAAGISTRYVK